MIWLRQSTASQEVILGPFLDDTDGKTAETALTIANTDIKIWKTGGTTESNKNSGGATHIASGRYYAVLDATDTNTIGPLEINVHVSGALPIKVRCCVLDEAVYDVLFGTTALSTYAGADTSGTTTLLSRIGSALTITSGRVNADITHIAAAAVSTSTAQLGVNVVNFGGSAGTFASGRPAVNASYIGGVPVTATTSITFPSTCTVATTTGAVGSVTGAVGSVTGNVGGNVTGSVGSIASGGITSASFAAGAINNAAMSIDGSELTAIPWNAAWDAEVQSEVEDALVVHRLDELLNADSDIDGAAPPTVGSVFHELMTKTTGSFTYDQTTDSLEALRDRGDAAWITATGFSTHSATDVWSVGTRVLTAGTNIVLPSNGLSNVTAWTVDITGSLSGSVGSVSGAVGSVTGNVGGNVTGSVGSLATQAKADVNAEVDTALADIHLDHLLATTYDPASKPGASDALLNELVESDAGVSRFTANALEQAPTGGSAPSASDIADEVQTRTIAAVTTVGSVSGAVGSVTGAVGSVTGDVGGKVLGGGSGTITGTGARADVRAWNGTAPGNLDANNYLPANVAAVNGNLTRANNLATSLDNYSATRGLAGTALPAAAAGAAGGIPTDSTGKTSFNDITAASVWAVGSRTLTSLSGLTVDTVTTLTNLPAITTNWLTAAGLAADAGAEIAAAVRDVTLTGAASGGIGDGIVAAYTSAAEASGYIQNLMNKLIVTTGTAQAGASSTITLASGASSTNNFYRNQIVYLHNGTGVGQSAVITAYNGTTKVATVAPNWNITPDNTSNYVILSVAVANLDSGGYSLAKTDGGSSIATATDLATVDGIVDAILEDTGTTIPATLGTPNIGSLADDIADVRAGVDNVETDTQSIQTVVGGIDTDVGTLITRVGSPVTTVSGDIALVKAKTDNLPTDPADQSAVEAAITAATSPLATAAALSTVDTVVDTILVDTDAIETRLTATRAGYLDNLSAGSVALASGVNVTQWRGSTPGNLDANGYVPGNVAAVNGNLTRAANLATSLDNYSATRGLAGTALPAAAADSAGGLIISDAGGLDADAVAANVASALADTNELQTDWANGGRLDTILDARASQTSVDDLPTLAEILDGGDVDGYTLEQTLKLCLATLAGKLSGASGTTVTIRAADDSKARLTATVDSSGNRTAVTLDAAG